MQVDNLFESSFEELEEIHRKAKITLEARRTLAEISRIISNAGGEISEKDLAETTLGDFAVIAAQNGLLIRLGGMHQDLWRVLDEN